MEPILENRITTLENNIGVKLFRIWATALIISGVLAFLAVPTTAQTESRIAATGEFEGRSGHVVSGGVTVLRTGSGYVVLLEPDFSLDEAPDPKLGFGNNGYEARSKFSELNSDNGLQAYRISASIDLEEYNEVWVWCEEFDVPLGVAHLQFPSSE